MGLTLKTTAPFFVMGMAAFAVSMGVLAWKQWGPQMLINGTASEPLGLYRLVRHGSADYRSGMYVVFPVPPDMQALVYGRHWMPDGVPFLKELAALGGDRVCVLPHRLEINGRYVGPVYEEDSQGRALPRNLGCFPVPQGMFFAASGHLDKSFDSRYFGPLPLTQLLGEARPVWTF
jgi:conjugative transfer signal peptidase TraF